MKTPKDVIIANELRNQLREERLRQGISQKQLARMAGISPPTLCKFEMNRRDGQLSVLLRVAVALGMTVEVRHV